MPDLGNTAGKSRNQRNSSRGRNSSSRPDRPHISVLKPIATTLARIAMIALGAGILLKHGAGEGIAGVVLVASCGALIGVPLYHWFPGDFDKARNTATEVYRQIKNK